MLTDEGEVVELIRHVGYPDELMDQFQRIPVNGSFPLTDVARSAQPVFLESLDAYLNRYPTLVDTVSHLSGTKALAVIPLTLGARVFGAIAFSFPQERAFDADSRAFMATLALQCAQALERARLYTLENAARLRVERERADLETVLEVVPIGIGISNDPDCRIIRVNPAFAAHLGLDPSVNA